MPLQSMGDDTKKQHCFAWLSQENASLLIFVLLGIVFHSVYMYSIFDVYFRSPLVHGMGQHESELKSSSLPVANRIVFIVSDGLRSDSFFELFNNRSDSFFHGLIRSSHHNVSWGVSHTRVPTESRPCHVAMFAGFYEDVNAVTTGWKENPVHFDSVFNQSNYVLQIGSPDVVKIFKGSHIDSLYYEPEMEDFASSDPAMLDRWVFDKLEYALQEDKYIQNRLREYENGVVIFLHLLGVDTSGHAYRPSGKGYFDNIIVVDELVRNVTRLVNTFFRDDKTAFIFTADHGMSSKGSHGDGNPECTRTPFVAWGSGIRDAKDGGYTIIDDMQSSTEKEMKYVREKWNLDPYNRKDIRQADVAPLMTAILGLKYPVNNVGTLPLSYLNESEEFRTHNLFANALQVFEQFKVKEEDKRKKTRLFFKEFDQNHNYERLIQNIRYFIEEKEYKKAQDACLDVITFSIKGLSYYQTYDWLILMAIITTGYLSWIAFLLTQTLKHYSEFSHQKVSSPIKEGSNILSVLIDLGSFVIFVLFNCYLMLQSSPLQYHIYILFPILFSNNFLKNLPFLIDYIQGQPNSISQVAMNSLVYVLGLEVMVIGYFKRAVFSSCFIILGIAPTLLGITFNPRFGWLAICIITSLFMLLPADYGSDTLLVCIGGAILMVSQIIWRRLYVHSPHKTKKGRYLFAFQLILLFLSILLVNNTENSLAQKKGLPYWNQVAAWSITFLSLILPLFSPPFYKMRMQSLVMAFACPFILLSVNYEVLFFAALDVLMLIWIKREINTREQPAIYTQSNNKADGGHVASKTGIRYLNTTDFSTALLFIFFINIGFFGTGNLATIASFELKSVYRFVTVFSPFLMSGILLLKIMTPLFITTLALSMIMRVTNTPQVAVFCIVVSLFDIMTLNFFFLVQDTGSWLEIGNSISRFAIGNIMILLLSLLFGVTQVYTKTVRRWVNGSKLKKM
jgi:phosphatidylinositol glycan class N